MRLMEDRHSDTAFERVVNTPPRGIGDKSVEAIRQQARARETSLWQAAKEALADGALPGRAKTTVAGFIALIDDLSQAVQSMRLHELAEHCVEASGLMQYHSQERGERGLARKENLEELVNACRQFTGELVFPFEDSDGAEVSELSEFLDQVALDAGDRQANQGPSVQMMTLHSAKGLEFPLVFLGGMEEGLFPHRMSAEEPGAHGGRAAPGLCRHYAGDERAVFDLRRNPPAAWAGQLQSTQPLFIGDTPGVSC